MAATAVPNNCDCDGSNAQAFYNVGTCEAEIWCPNLDIQSDLNIQDTTDANEKVKRDKNQCYKVNTQGKSTLQVTGEVSCDCAYEGNQTILSMVKCLGGQPVDWALLNNCIDVVGACGRRGCMLNFEQTNNNPSEGDSTLSFDFRPADTCTGCECPVRWVEVLTPGTIDDIVIASVSALTALEKEREAQERKALLSRLEEQYANLGNTVKEEIYPSIQPLLDAEKILGKSQDTIDRDHKAVSVAGEVAFPVFGQATNASLTENFSMSALQYVKKSMFEMLLKETIKELRSKIEGKVVVPTKQS